MKKLILFAAMFLFGIFAMHLAAATTDTIGGTANGASSFSIGGATPYINYEPITASGSGNLQTIGVNLGTCGGTNHIRVAIYSTDGTPSTLLGQSAETVCADGWNDVALTGVSVVSGTYWLAIMGDSSSTTFYTNMGPNRCYQQVTYGTFPATAAETCDTNIVVNMRITYAGAPPPPLVLAFIKWMINYNQWVVLMK